MRVCFRTSVLQPEYSGAAAQALTLARALRTRGIRVWFVCFRTRRELPPEDLCEGFSVYRIFLGDSTLRRMTAYARLALLLVRKRREFEVLHSHGESWLVTLVGRGLGRPVIQKLTLMGVDNPSALRRLRFGWLRRLALSRASVIVAPQSEIEKDCLQEGLHAHRVLLIPNGVDLRRFFPPEAAVRTALRGRLGCHERDFVAVFVGRLSRRKGADTLLAAWREFLRRSDAARLFLLGPEDTDLRADPAFQGPLSDLERGGHVARLGYVCDTSPFLQAADAFCLPSLAEGLPNALLEAMACGVAPVLTVQAGLEFLTAEENCLMIPQLDPSLLAAALSRLASDPALRRRLGTQAVRTVRNHFDIEEVAERFGHLYRDLTGVHRATMPDSAMAARSLDGRS